MRLKDDHGRAAYVSAASAAGSLVAFLTAPRFGLLLFALLLVDTVAALIVVGRDDERIAWVRTVAWMNYAFWLLLTVIRGGGLDSPLSVVLLGFVGVSPKILVRHDRKTRLRDWLLLPALALATTAVLGFIPHSCPPTMSATACSQLRHDNRKMAIAVGIVLVLTVVDTETDD